MKRKKSYQMMKCVKCSFEHKITDNYVKCEKCNCKQFHIVKRIFDSKAFGFPLILCTIFIIVMITYFVIRIARLLGWLK